jgi:hypothetical protein
MAQRRVGAALGRERSGNAADPLHQRNACEQRHVEGREHPTHDGG